jgi:hypothetical protein
MPPQTSGEVQKNIALMGLKRFALETLLRGPLRDDILSQPDEVSAEEFLASARVWLRLSRSG